MRRTDKNTAQTFALAFLLLGAPLGAFASAGTCTANDQCGTEEFCAHLFGECGMAGKCETRPKECVEHGHPIVKPMCGCDGKTYDNTCLAAVAGVSVDHEGACAAK